MRIKINGEVLIIGSLYLLVFYLCLPFSMVVLNSILIRLLVIVSAALFVIGLIITNRLKQLIVFLVLFLFTLVYWIITWSVQLDSLSYVYYSFASLLFVFGGIILYQCEDETLLKHLFVFITIIFLITAITSIFGLRIYPRATRELARGSTYDTSLDFTEYKTIYRRMNIASWSQAYGMLFTIPASIMIWKNKRNPIFIIFPILTAVMLVAAQITFAVLLAVLLIVLILIIRKSNVKTVILLLFFAFIALVLLFNMEPLLTAAVNLSRKAGFSFLTTKLNDMKELLVNNNAIGDAAGRGMLYSTSLNTFLSNPVAGLVLDGKATTETIGFHSEFFDFIGSFGLTGLIVVLASFAGYYDFLRKVDHKYRKDLMIVFIGFIVLFILNPVFNSPQIFVGAFLYPILASRFCEMSKTDKHLKRIGGIRKTIGLRIR